MKRKLMGLCLMGILGCMTFLSIRQKKEAMSTLTQTNISFLTASADAEDAGGTTLSGPRKQTDCNSTTTPHKMVCYCENDNNCSDSACY